MSLPHRFACCLLIAAFTQPALAEEPVSFRRDLAPILQAQCVACHGPKKAEGGYRADSFERLLKEGDSGSPGFLGGAIDDSEAFRRMVSEDPDDRMPLEGDPLPTEQIELFRRWIAEGAKFDGTDPAAELVTVIPPPDHPAPPEKYPFSVPVTAVAFSADGKLVYAAGYHEVTVWDATTGKLANRISNVGQRVYALALSPNGQQLAVGCGAPGRLGETRIFDLASGKLVTVIGTTSDVVLDVVYAPQGDRLAIAAADSMVRVFETKDWKESLTITSHSDWVMAVCWNGDGTRLATASRDKTAKLFDAKSGELLITYSGHGQPVKGVAFHPEGKELYSAGGDNKIHRWKAEDAKKSADIGFGGEVYKLPVVGGFLFAPSADKTVRQFEAASHKQVRSFGGHQDWALSVAFHEGSKRVASGGFDGRLQIWNLEDGKAVASFLATPGRSDSSE